MKKIIKKLKLPLLTFITITLVHYYPTNVAASSTNPSTSSLASWAGSKYEIQCTMCAACDNPCNTPTTYSSPPPPPPPYSTSINCPPPPGNNNKNYYSPPTPPPPPPPAQPSYGNSPPQNTGGYSPPPPNTIVPYFPFYYHSPPPPSSAVHLSTNSFLLTLIYILVFYKLF